MTRKKKPEGFVPGLYNFYLLQAPRRDNADAQTLGIHVTRGKKTDSVDSIPVTFEKGFHFATLGQHDVRSQNQLQELYDRYKEIWIREYDLSPLASQEPPV